MVDVEVDVAPLRAAFTRLGRRFKSLRGAWAQVGARMEEAAHPLVPVEAGELVDSLRARPGPMGVEFGSDLIYAGVQDRGWPAHNIEGHHFMAAAEEAGRQGAVDLIAPEIQREIDRVGLG